MHLTRSIALAAIIATSLTAPAVQAQDVTALAGCTGIDNDIERLACFDRVAAPLSNKDVAVASCTPMTVEDLKLDYQDIVGKCAEVSGLVMQAGELALLMQNQFDASPFYIETSGLSRDERRILLNCPTGCQLTISGKVGETTYGKGMIAATLWQ